MHKPQIGLFDRVASILELCERMPLQLSDEEAEGLLKFLPADSRHSIRAMLIPRIRESSVLFLKLVAEWVHAARRAHAEGKKVIIVPFNFPPELIHAFEGAVPITSEILTTLGVVALEGQGERYWDLAMGLGLPDHSCSSNAIELGSILAAEDFKPDAIVSAAPGGCDVNAKIHEFVSHYLDIPQFFIAKIPNDSERGREQYRLETYRLIRGLEQFLGEKLSEQRLREVMQRANRCTELHYELWDLHRHRPSPVPNLFSLYLYGVRFAMWGTESGVAMLESMVELSKRRLAARAYPAPEERARTLWCYTSYYYDFANLFNWMEESGYSHLGDGLDLYFPQPVDLSSMDSMIEGFADAARNMPMTRQVGGQSMSKQWTEDCIQAARELDADCAIFCGHHSCKQTWSVVSILRNELMRRTGTPLLVLQGDSWIRRMTPISVVQREIREFVENVVTAKGGQKRKLRKRGQAAATAAQEG